MGLNVSRRMMTFAAVSISVAAGGLLVTSWLNSKSFEATEGISVRQPIGDVRTLQELMTERFAALTEDSVRQECDAWLAESEWTFGQSLSELYKAGSGTSEARVASLFRDFRLRQIEQYSENTKDAEPVQTKVQSLLTAWAELADDTNSESRHRLRSLVRESIASGSTDPLTKILELTYEPPRDYAKAEGAIAALPDEVSEAGYGIYFRLLAQHRRFVIAHEHDAVNLGAIGFNLIDDVVAYSDQFSKDENLTRVTWQAIINAYRRPLRDSEQEELLRRLLISEETDPLFLHMLIGFWYREQAVRLRGGGFIDSVPDDKWDEIRDLFSIASTHQQKAWLLRPDLPMAAAAMVELANVSPGHDHWDERKWLELSCRAQFDYITSYRTFLYSLMPRWGGDYLKMLEFGRECAATKAFETTVPFFLIDCVSQVAKETPGGTTWQAPLYVDALTEFWHSLENWAEENKIERTAPQWQNQYSLQAAVMVRNGRYAEAVNALEHARWPPADQVMADVVSHPQFSASMAYAMTEPNVEGVAEAEARFGQSIPARMTPEQLNRVVEEFQSARKRSTHPRAALYFAVRENTLRQQLAFLNGEVVSLLFDESLHNWTVLGGQGTVENATTLLMSNLDVGPSDMQAIPNVGFKPPFVVAATLERIRGENVFPRLGINVGPVSQANMLSKPGGMAFILNDQPRIAGTMHPNGRQQQAYYVPELQDRAKLSIVVRPDSYEMYVNDAQVPVKPVSVFHPDGKFSFGGNPYERHTGKIRLSDVQIQRIAEQDASSENGDTPGQP